MSMMLWYCFFKIVLGCFLIVCLVVAYDGCMMAVFVPSALCRGAVSDHIRFTIDVMRWERAPHMDRRPFPSARSLVIWMDGMRRIARRCNLHVYWLPGPDG